MDSKAVKGIDLDLLNWYRTILVNVSHVVAKFTATASYGIWSTHPVNVSLIVIFFRKGADIATQELQNPYSWEAQTSLKLSILVEGDWQFNHSQNTLHVDFVITGQFESGECGDMYKVFNETSSEVVYEVYGPNSTRSHLTFLTFCFTDHNTISQKVIISPPLINSRNARFELVYPSFERRLDYDPSMAVLLGALTSSFGHCGTNLLGWILPAAFLAGAGLIILLVIIVGSTPCLHRYVLGEEGDRVRHLRTYVSKNMAVDGSIESPPVEASGTRTSGLYRPQDVDW